ncbi:Predicted Peptidoglycan domain-containing protein [Pseudarcicella hirudinis]|uniref:Predicted Peptidoglycan domain-containing protein n=1 Tax=Pseudarcicella hirudinis TaxID=1079859 RepID=A0A1I5X581_9BACT|nr:glycosyl hydrolase 108 family protein [Pseudarcicella hirudinis]SFQ27162.1 Predicted Peptidoglycan domain-containing protein [Pseudarcicella hirudinis]SFQ47556.1 Predicted Peptidoglycan domain-containing protein [Pseudarcicella hirudinis]
MKRLLLFLIVFICNTSKAADFEKYFPHLLKAEGILFTIVQYDRGGATKFGVTFQTYRIACNKSIALVCDKNRDGKLTSVDLSMTTQKDIKPIYKFMYWKQAKAHEIKNQAVAEVITDILVNCGPGRGNIHLKAIQGLVGAKRDGVLGSETVKKINQANSKKLYTKIYNYRASYYKKIGVGSQRKFLRGWINRIVNLKKIHLHEKYV